MDDGTGRLLWRSSAVENFNESIQDYVEILAGFTLLRDDITVVI
jgi:hypothetical protein